MRLTIKRQTTLLRCANQKLQAFFVTGRQCAACCPIWRNWKGGSEPPVADRGLKVLLISLDLCCSCAWNRSCVPKTLVGSYSVHLHDFSHCIIIHAILLYCYCRWCMAVYVHFYRWRRACSPFMKSTLVHCIIALLALAFSLFGQSLFVDSTLPCYYCYCGTVITYVITS